ncbi:uncharacterized protein [Henckelia pumila]|uniref:uncharacterized protein n=1 Tax=Henckelia pumila TaxID=405737 RepID=UPI003C6E45EB
MRPLTFRPITKSRPGYADIRVSDLLTETGEWNWQQIHHILWPIDHDEIRRLPQRCLNDPDKLIWHFNTDGAFSVRSGYHLASSVCEGSSTGTFSGAVSFLRKLGNLKIQSKVKTFIWKAIHEICPSRFHLASRGIKLDTICPRCQSFPEHSFHVLWHCERAREVWFATSLWPLLSQFVGSCFMDLWSWVCSFGVRNDLALFAMVSWSLWLDRNQFVFENKFRKAEEVVSRACSLWEQYDSTLKDRIVIPSTQSPIWQKPILDFAKINVDAAVSETLPGIGVGWWLEMIVELCSYLGPIFCMDLSHLLERN